MTAQQRMSNQAVAHKLVIVESPAKARTIEGYLGRGYVVESSIGHIRDLPQSAADIPAKLKGESWARLGVDVDNDFEPVYVVARDKKSHMTKLKGLLKDADELYLATDEDREGEAIAWHLLDELKPKVPVHRMVFHEITPQAINAAVDNPRDIDMDLVEAQEARRILDRLYGYEVSPVLWRKVMSGLSAGRVQSVATRLVVDRERERMKFRVASYWDLEGTFDAGEKHDQRMFPAKLHSIDGTRVARGSDFGQDGELKAGAKVVHLTKSRAEALAGALHDTDFAVRSVESKPYTRRPYAPFRTTTMQQEASRKLGFSASSTMSVAQRLYENGFITYMRTDSTTLSETAISAARSQARDLYGAEYIPDAPRVYASKVKNAQEAHEAIRPAGDSFRTPAQTGLTGDQFRLYELIWMRTIASQMKDARRQLGDDPSRWRGQHRRGRRVLRQRPRDHLPRVPQGLRRGSATTTPSTDDQETRLPNVARRATRSARRAIRAEGHSTKPPARYTEATLIKELEEREIGRPSTYASIIGTILNRGYVYKKGTALVPAWLAFSVIRLLEEHFTRLVSYEFTARMEDVLDEIAGGRRDRNTELAEFYFGSGEVEGLKKLVTELGDIDAKELATFPIGGADSWGIALRVGKYGPYLEGPGDDGTPAAKKANVPDDLPPDELTMEKAKELLANPAGEEIPLGHAPRDRARGRREERSLRPLRHRAAARGRPEEGQAAHRLAVQGHVARHDHPRAGGAAAVPAARGRRRRRGHRDHRAERPLRPLPEAGHRLALAGDRAAALRHHPRRRRCAIYAQPKQRGRGRRHRPAQGARQRPGLRARRSWSRRAGSGSTSPTASTTPPCARTTPSRRSPSSAPPSSSPSAAPRARRRRPPSVGPRSRPPRRPTQEDDQEGCREEVLRRLAVQAGEPAETVA